MSKLKRTNLILSITCKNCGAVWFLSMIYGGVEIDAETTMLIAEAYEKGDLVRLHDNESLSMSECKCETLF